MNRRDMVHRRMGSIGNGATQQLRNMTTQFVQGGTTRLIPSWSSWDIYHISIPGEAHYLPQAGLFTAIVTAFTIESYKWLKPEPEDTMISLLMTLSQQLSNSSLPAAPDPTSIPFTPTTSAVRINCFWFLAITISLSAALVGILGKQWIRAYQRDASLPPEQALSMRQFRYQGLTAWGIPQMVSFPALLLEIALFLFFAGILDLLWSDSRHKAVAICSSVVVATMALIMILSTLLPSVYYIGNLRFRSIHHLASTPCPYKSPQSYLVLAGIQNVLGMFWDIRDAISVREDGFKLLFLRILRSWRSLFMVDHSEGWQSFERTLLHDRNVEAVCGHLPPGNSLASDITNERRLGLQALEWIQYNLAFSANLRRDLHFCILDSTIPCNNPHSRNAHPHAVSIPYTVDECNKSLHPDIVVAQLMRNDEPAFVLELCVRQVGKFPNGDLTYPLLEMSLVLDSAYTKRTFL